MSQPHHSGDSLPLSGQRILLTRPDDESNATFMADLIALGAEVIHLPLITVQPVPFEWPPSDPPDWIFFTSKNAVKAMQGDPQLSQWLREQASIAAIGPATQQALMDQGFAVDFVSPVHEAENAARIFGETYPLASKTIVWPCGDLASPQLKTTLEAQGAVVQACVVYQTTPKTTLSEAERALFQQPVQLRVFTSASAVETWQTLQKQAGIEAPTSPIACLGPKTAKAALAVFGKVDIQAAPYTLAGLTQAIRRYFEQNSERNQP